MGPWALWTRSLEALWVGKEAEQGHQGVLPAPGLSAGDLQERSSQLCGWVPPASHPGSRWGRRQEPGLWGSISQPHTPACLLPGCVASAWLLSLSES